MSEFSAAHGRLSNLITTGVYVAGKLPSERALEVALGVSRTTVRKVIARLERDGVLTRTPTRRARIARSQDGSGGLRRVAFIAPAFASAGVGRWENSVRCSLASDHPGVHLSSLRYRSREDPVFHEATHGFDGVFVLLGSEAGDERLRAALVGPGLAPVLSLEQDLSQWGIPSIQLYPPGCVHDVLDRMHALGHRRIGCLNTQPVDAIVAAWIQAWQVWMAAHRCQGPLVSDPVMPFEDPLPKAHRLMGRCMDDHPEVTAWLCTVLPVARGAIRAIHDRGMVAGRELSIASIDGEFQESYLVPSLACVESVNPQPYIAVGLDWMLSGEQRVWHGPLRVHPSMHRFHVGESLGPVRVISDVSS